MKTNVQRTKSGELAIAFGDPVNPLAALRLDRQTAATIAREIIAVLGLDAGTDPGETLETQTERYGAKQVGDAIELTVGGATTLTTKACSLKLMDAISKVHGGATGWEEAERMRRERDDARAQLAACGVIARGAEVKAEDLPKGPCDSVEAVIKLVREAEQAADELRMLGVNLFTKSEIDIPEKMKLIGVVDHILGHLPNYERDKAQGDALLAAVKRGRTFRIEPMATGEALAKLLKIFEKRSGDNKPN